MSANDAQSAPRDLHSTQYAAWILENTLGTPAVKSNLEVISQAIESIARSKFRDEKWKRPIFTAFVWLNRQTERAKELRVKTNHLFFMNGDYNELPDAEAPKLPEFIPCEKCSSGWKTIEIDGKKRVVSCECRNEWIAACKRMKG